MTPIEVVVIIEPVPHLLVFGNAFVEDPDIVSTRAEVDRSRTVDVDRHVLGQLPRRTHRDAEVRVAENGGGFVRCTAGVDAPGGRRYLGQADTDADEVLVEAPTVRVVKIYWCADRLRHGALRFEQLTGWITRL
jgi:hypothetical protein